MPTQRRRRQRPGVWTWPSAIGLLPDPAGLPSLRNRAGRQVSATRNPAIPVPIRKGKCQGMARVEAQSVTILAAEEIDETEETMVNLGLDAGTGRVWR